LTPARGKGSRRDVAIYSPAATMFYGGEGLVPGAVPQGGGAELQMALLARGLTENGLRVAMMVWPSGEARSLPDPQPDLIDRAAYAGDRPRTGRVAEGVAIWRAMRAADADSYLFRGSGPQLQVAASFCRLHRRKLIFSAANDLDFDFERPDRQGWQLALYRWGLGRADLVVVQREEQLELARRAGVGPLTLIPSLAEPAEPTKAKPEAFLWVGRLADYKRPLAFVELARSLPEVPFRMISFHCDDTDPELIAELERRSAGVENLELFGRTPRSEVLERIERAFAVVLTSAAEGMPNVFLEAWSRGVPVISLEYDPDGKIESKRLGLAARGSPDRLREATETLWRDPKLRAELGERGREYVREVHSPEAVSRRWAEVLREMLEKEPLPA
jgi:glycosyltransferase involved in cell wall biosynthesis